MATNARIAVGGVLKDPDDVFKPRGGSVPRANTHVHIGLQDFADRYYASTGGDTPSGSSNLKIKVGGSYIDVLTLFRDIDYTEPPTASLTGSSSVALGGGGGGSWTWEVNAAAGIYRYRFYVVGHGGTWTYPGSTIFTASGTSNWSSPFGSPDISNTADTYTFVIEVEDVDGLTASDSMSVTVS